MAAALLPLPEHRLALSNLDLLLPPFDVGILFNYNIKVGMKNKMMISMKNKMMISMVRNGLMIGCSFDHRVADAYSINKFLVAWADMTRSNLSGGKSMALVSSPDYCHSLLHPRNPGHPDAVIDNFYTLVKAASSNLPQEPPLFHLQSRIYRIKGNLISRLEVNIFQS